MTKYKIIFAGTSLFAVPALLALSANDNFEIVGVVTMPDRPAGRSKELKQSPVKETALSLKEIKIFQPEKIKNLKAELEKIKPDFLIVAAYGEIIPEDILSLPKFGSINIHASLLPRWRGASPIQSAILAGDKESGVTIMQMDAHLDTGPILSQAKIDIEDNDTALSLGEKLSKIGADTLADTLIGFAKGKIKAKKQDDKQATLCRVIKKEDGKINWQDDAEKIERMVRAYTPWPSAYGFLNLKEGKKIFKILKVKNIISSESNQRTGKFFLFDDSLAIQCGYKALVLDQVQLEGKKTLSADEFVRGKKEVVGLIIE